MTTPKKAFLDKAKWNASKLGYTSGSIDEAEVQTAMRLHMGGQNDEAVELLSKVAEQDRSPKAWRILGHSELARANVSNARRCHSMALQANLESQNKVAASDDLVNIAATYIDEEDYDGAWKAADEAFALTPGAWAPHVVKISVLNNRGDKVALMRYIRELMQQRPGLLDDPDFRRHLDDDFDFIGIDALIQKEENS